MLLLGPTHRSKIVTKRKVLATALGLWLTPVQLSVGQQAGTSTSVAQPQLRVNVVSKVSRGCGPTIQPTGMQSHAEELLRAGGITVSNIYNAQIAVDTDCAPLRRQTVSPGMSVNQCLSFLEVGALPGAERRTGFSTTWRSCQSLTCSRSKCEAIVNSRIDTLVNMFLAEVTTPRQAILERINAAPLQSAPSQPERTGLPLILVQIFLALLILGPLSLLLYWQLRDRIF